LGVDPVRVRFCVFVQDSGKYVFSLSRSDFPSKHVHGQAFTPKVHTYLLLFFPFFLALFLGPEEQSRRGGLGRPSVPEYL